MIEGEKPSISNDSSAASCHSGSSRCAACWRLPALLAVVLTAIVLVNGRGIRRETAGIGQSTVPVVANETNQTVSLIVNFGDGRTREWTAIAWREGMNVDDLLAAAATRNGEDVLEFARQGSGASAFLTTLDGVANEGAGGRNWTYQVNGKRADRSFSVFELQPGDKVLWSFGGSQ
jgi:hypothetical protein